MPGMQLVMTFLNGFGTSISQSTIFLSSLKYLFNLHIYSSQIANAVVAYLNANDYEAFTQVRSFLQAV